MTVNCVDEIAGFARSKAFPYRGTAIGFYNFMTGLIYLPASAIAGLLWLVNPSYAFTFAATVSLGALVIFLSLKKLTIRPKKRCSPLKVR